MLKLSPTSLVTEHDVQAYNVKRIKYVKDNFDPLRSKSKNITFALQYRGTANTLVNNSGFTPEEAKEIVANYKGLYKESEEYATKRIAQATEDGYVEIAFGLRLRTPILKRTVMSSSMKTNISEAEARTAGNALSQSYCQLTNRASNEFMQRVRASKYRYDILACMWIHDAIYIMCKNDIETVKFVNDNLIDCMEWQDLPEIQHDEVTLGAELDIYYPTWKDTLTLSNKLTSEEIAQRVEDYLKDRDSTSYEEQDRKALA